MCVCMMKACLKQDINALKKATGGAPKFYFENFRRHIEYIYIYYKIDLKFNVLGNCKVVLFLHGT